MIKSAISPSLKRYTAFYHDISSLYQNAFKMAYKHKKDL